MKNIENLKHLLLMFLFALCGVLGAQAKATDSYDNVTFPQKDYQPKKCFMGNITFDESTTIWAKINLTFCSNNNDADYNEDILDIGQNISAWAGKNIHMYYFPSSMKLQVNIVDDALKPSCGVNYYRKEITLKSELLDIKLNATEGLVINGTKEELPKTYLTTCEFFSVTNMQVGSREGNVSNAMYGITTDGTEPTVSETGIISTLPITDYTASGKPFCVTTAFDAAHAIVAKMDLSKCTSPKENILSMGQNIGVWGNGDNNTEKVCNLHLYYTPDIAKPLTIYYINKENTNTKQQDFAVTDPTNVEISLSPEGLFLNGTRLTIFDNSIQTFYNDVTTLQIGSKEGKVRSNATYKSIALEDYKNVILPFKNHQVDGTRYYATTVVRKNATIKATLDLSTCSENAEENVFSIGTDIAEWGNTSKDYNIHVYYNKKDYPNRIQICYVHGSDKSGWINGEQADNNNCYFAVDDPSNVDIEISRWGLYLNGQKLEAFTSYLQQTDGILSKTLQIGSAGQGSKPTTVTYTDVHIDNATFAVPSKQDYIADGEELLVEKSDYKDKDITLSLDLSTCGAPSGVNGENILSFGSNIQTWGVNATGCYNLHFYYVKGNDKPIEICYCDATGEEHKTNNAYAVEDLTNVVIRLTPDGLFLDGVLLPAYTEFVSRIYNNVETLQIGSRQGNMRSHATYKSSDYEDYNPSFMVPLTRTFKANGSDTFMAETAFDVTKKITAQIDLNNCTGTNENILSIGQDIDVWGNGDGQTAKAYNLHFYYTKSTNNLICTLVDPDYEPYNTTNNTESVESKTLVPDDKILNIELSVRGLYINGELQEGANKSLTNGLLAHLLKQESLEIGSEQGTSRSNATYNSILIEDRTDETPELPLVDYNPYGVKFCSTYKGEFKSNTKVTADIDLTKCTTAKENVLSIGTDAASWEADGQSNIHMYYLKDEQKLEIHWVSKVNPYPETTNGVYYVGLYNIADKLNVELENSILKVNGQQVMSSSDTEGLWFEEALSTFYGKTIQIGSCEGKFISHATYNVTVEGNGSMGAFGALPWEDITANGTQKFATPEFGIDFSTQKLVAKIDLAPCLEEPSSSINGLQAILSIGTDISSFGNYDESNLHFYYNPVNDSLQVDLVDYDLILDNAAHKREQKFSKYVGNTATDKQLNIELSCLGLFINGNKIERKSNPDDPYLGSLTYYITNLLNQKTIQVGSRQGNFRSYARYVDVHVENLKDDEKEEDITLEQIISNKDTTYQKLNFTPSLPSKKFKLDLADYDFTKQELVVDVDVSNCDAGTLEYKGGVLDKVHGENILSIGTDIRDWGAAGIYNIHMYYAQGFLEVNYLSSTIDESKRIKKHFAVTNKEFSIRFSDQGLFVNNDGDPKLSSSQLFILLVRSTGILAGSIEGENRSKATYKSIIVQDKKELNQFSPLWMASPSKAGDRKISAHATMIPYPSTATMQSDKAYYDSPWVYPSDKNTIYQNLNGTWDFKYVPGDGENLGESDKYVEKDNDLNIQYDKIEVPLSWEMAGYGRPVYTNIGYAFINTPPMAMRGMSDMTQETDHNATGVYRRIINVGDWKTSGKRIILHFDGVSSAAAVYVNGTYLGYSEGSNTDAEFDITSALQTGDNMLAVKVFRWCDGSYLEGQDMWNFSGINRDVYLYAIPQVAIRDYRITPNNLASNAKSGSGINVALTVENKTKASADKTITVTLKDAAGTVVATQTKDYSSALESSPVNFSLGEGSGTGFKTIHPWSAEDPYLYTVEVSQKNTDGTEDMAFSAKYGFRTVKIDNGVLKVNDKRVFLKGVNSHDINPERGHATNVETMLKDITMMKRANINTFRASHYPRQPKMLAMLDAYGLYAMESADIECHFEQKLTDSEAWLVSMMDRTQRMVLRDRNHPSIISWSLGNESGRGKNFDKTREWVKANDSRIIHYADKLSVSDVNSQMYPTVSKVRNSATTAAGADVKPIFYCEYAHAMGQAVGNLKEFWDAIESSNIIAGGCIWDWADQAIYNVDELKNGVKTKNGFHLWTAGYDYNKVDKGKGFEGNFLDNGLVTPDRRWTGKLAEVKKVYQYVDFTKFENNTLTFKNKYMFTNLDQFNLVARLLKDGRLVEEQTIAMPSVVPDATGTLDVYFNTNVDNNAEEVVDFQLVLKDKTLWADASYEVARQQFNLSNEGTPQLADYTPAKGGSIAVADKTISGTDADGKAFAMTFAQDGKIQSWQYGGKDILKQGFDFNSCRNIDNDKDVNALIPIASSATTTASSLTQSGDNYVMSVNGTATNCNYTIDYTFYPDATVDMAVTFKPTGDTRRLGLGVQFAPGFENVEFYGRGPWTNYVDRKTGTYLGRYCTTVDDMVEEQIHPQTYGDHQDLRELVLSNAESGLALDIKAGGNVAFSLSHFDESAWCGIEGNPINTLWNNRNHWYDLTRNDQVFAHFDYWQRGLGNNSCSGETSLPAYQCPITGEYSYTLRITPRFNK